MILAVNSDYFLKQRQQVDLCNGEVLYFLCGTDELRLQKANTRQEYFDVGNLRMSREILGFHSNVNIDDLGY
jgi:hypothetical protein